MTFNLQLNNMHSFHYSVRLLGPLFLGAFWVQLIRKTRQNVAKSSKLYTSLHFTITLEFQRLQPFTVLFISYYLAHIFSHFLLDYP